MLNVIERSLMKPVGSQPLSASANNSSPQTPTISSILRSDKPLMFPSREYRGSPSAPPMAQSAGPQDLPKEGLVVMQVQQALKESSAEGVTLDLSTRKRGPSPMAKMQQQQHQHPPRPTLRPSYMIENMHYRDGPPPQSMYQSQVGQISYFFSKCNICDSVRYSLFKVVLHEDFKSYLKKVKRIFVSYMNSNCI